MQFRNPYPQPYVTPYSQPTPNVDFTKNMPNINQDPGGLPRAINYYADYGGCGHYRMIWPEEVINSHNLGVINGGTAMVLEPKYYYHIKSIRFQRQATQTQSKFVELLKKTSEQNNFKLIYEIDDIVFAEDIPDYNKSKEVFDNQVLQESIKKIMGYCNIMTVTTPFMKKYFEDKIQHPDVRVIPNYLPKFWMDRFYNPDKLMSNLEKHKSKPRIGYLGSGTHIDVKNKCQRKDDFEKINQFIIKTRKQFKWVFLGCYPFELNPYIKNGEIEYHKWAKLYEYPYMIDNLNLNAVIAPLQNNNFNKAKSNIKFLETAAFGIPGVFQNLCTYDDAIIKFDKGEEMVDKLTNLVSNQDYYSNISQQSRKYAETMWLENNIDKFIDLYFK